jgi:hypothetical protein
MTPAQRSELKWFFPETLVYAVLVAAFCCAVFKLLGHPLQALSRHHRVGYAFLAIGLMIFQGYVLERFTHAIMSLVRRQTKAPR